MIPSTLIVASVVFLRAVILEADPIAGADSSVEVTARQVLISETGTGVTAGVGVGAVAWPELRPLLVLLAWLHTRLQSDASEEGPSENVDVSL
jgi:hypothetical protein